MNLSVSVCFYGENRALPVCHFLPIPAEGVVRWSRLTAAQRLSKTTVEGAEALQVGYEVPVSR